MKKDEVKDLLCLAFDYGKKLLVQWHDFRFQQIRFEYAHKRILRLRSII